MWPFGKKAVAVAPDAPLGMTYAEIFAQPQFQYQCVFIVGLHLVMHLVLTKVPNPFSSRAGLFAHYLPFLVTFAGMAVYGDYLWLYDEQMQDPNLDKIWADIPGAKVIVTSMLAIQIYDVPTSFLIPDLRQPTFIAHHIVVLILAFAGLRFRAFLYYGVYFMGVIESSSPLLAMVDAFRDFPKLGQEFPILNEVCRVCFAIVFFAVRIIGWVGVSIDFWRDALSLFAADAPRHGMPLYMVAFWLFIHTGLTILQTHWAIIILKAAYAMATGNHAARANEAKNA